ncbi:MAG: aspartate kinase [Spirochaetia bacterium]
MQKIVVKFGGSNLKNTDDVDKIVSTVKKYNRPLVIVVSAFYGITNYLTESVRLVPENKEKIRDLTSFLTEMKGEIIEKHIVKGAAQDSAAGYVEERLKKLEQYLFGIHYIEEVPEFVRDVVLSYGERLSSIVLTSILKAKGVDAVEMLPEDLGLITNGEYGNASVDFEKSSDNVWKNLRDERTYVVPGFYGISESGKVTLLGRGGSDYSAACIAKCINAESLDIWKDVDGFMSGDPKIVENPVRITDLTYKEAAELAYFGASILHPRTVEPLMGSGLAIRIMNITGTENEIKPITTILETTRSNEKGIKSVTYSDDFGLVKVAGPGVGIHHGILARVATRLDEENINIKSVVTSQISINLYLKDNDVEHAYRVLSQMKIPTVEAVIQEKDLAIIALVGESLLETPAVTHRMISSMTEKGIHMHIVSIGASDVAAYFVVDRADMEQAVKEVHAAFFTRRKI